MPWTEEQIVTDRLRLRAAVDADKPALAALLTDPDVRRHLGGPVDEATVEQFLASTVGERPDAFVVELLDDALIGEDSLDEDGADDAGGEPQAEEADDAGGAAQAEDADDEVGHQDGDVARGHLRVVGAVTLGRDRDRRDLEVSYQFLPEVWGRGIAAEAVGALLEWAWSTHTDDSIIAVTQTANDRSLRLLDRLGFVAEDEFEEFDAPQTQLRVARPA